MGLRDLIDPSLINLELKATSRDEVLKELVSMLGLEEEPAARLYKILWRQQRLGSTGIGRGIAFVYFHTTPVSRLRVGYGRQPAGVDFRAIDDKPVYHFFLILSPRIEDANQFLPTLGKLAQFAKEPDVPDRLAQLKTAEAFLDLLDEKGL